MSDSTNEYISILNSIVKLATQYQLCISGEFTISRYKQFSKIDNEIFGNLDLKFINAGRLDFDGGIELTLIATGELAKIFHETANDSSILVSIYNLHGEDYELENYIIKDREDCEFLNVDKKVLIDSVDMLAHKLNEYWSGDRIGALRSFCAIKLGYSS
jgi:hypothetical protein